MPFALQYFVNGKGVVIQMKGKSIFDLDFTDDIAMLETSKEELQNNMNVLKQHSKKIGLLFTANMCELVCINGNTADVKGDGT